MDGVLLANEGRLLLPWTIKHFNAPAHEHERRTQELAATVQPLIRENGARSLASVDPKVNHEGESKRPPHR